MNSILRIFGLLIILSATAFSQDSEWKLEKNKDGIKVYTKKAMKSRLKDSRASVVINTSANKAFALFTDFERHNDWMDRIRVSRMLKKASDQEFYVYYEVAAPWPASDRDVAILYKIVKLENGGFRMDAISQPDYVPKKDGMVRVPESQSSWEFVPRGKNQVEVIFTNHSDPGGSLPDWMTNMAATDNPFNTLLNLRKKLESQ